MLPNFAGTSAQSAFDLARAGSRSTLADGLDGATTAQGFYKFSITERQAVGFSMTGLTGDVDLTLFSQDEATEAVGNLLQQSTNSSLIPEWIETVLDPGQYVVQASLGSRAASAEYNFNFSIGGGVSTADVLWRNEAASQNVVWQMKDGQVESGYFVDDVSADWQVAGVADLTGDGTADVLWRNEAASQNVVWQMKDGQVESGYFLNDVPGEWQIAGVGDFDGSLAGGKATTLGGDSLETAIDLGSGLTGTASFDGLLDGTENLEDFFKFALSESQEVNLSISASIGEAEVALLDGAGQIVVGPRASIRQRVEAGNYFVRVSRRGEGDTEYSLGVSGAEAGRVTEISPTNGEELVTLTRETIVRFSEAVVPGTVNQDSLKIIANGEELAGNIRVSSTEKFATFFYDEPLPQSTEVRVMVDGDLILGRDGLAIDADGDGTPGGMRTADFRTLPLTQIPGTDVWGYVYDSYNRNPDGSDIPLEGVEIRLDSLDLSATTNDEGYFILEDVPAPDFYVYIDGSGVVNTPEGRQYASLGKAFHSVPGQNIQLEMDGDPFNIYLPTMAEADVVTLSETEKTQVGFGPESLALLQDFIPAEQLPLLEEMQVTFVPGSAQDDSGTAATRATVVPVDPKRLPAPLPPGAEPGLVISIQAGSEQGFNRETEGGATNFDVPAPVVFPNLEGLAAGEKSLIWSFDHDAGDWVVIGTGTVSEDRKRIVSDEEVGVLAPGWHFANSGFVFNGRANRGKHTENCDISNEAASISSAVLSSANTGVEGLAERSESLKSNISKIKPSPSPVGIVSSALSLTADLAAARIDGEIKDLEVPTIANGILGLAASIGVSMALASTAVVAGPALVTGLTAVGLASSLIGLGLDLLTGRQAINDLKKKVNEQCSKDKPSNPPLQELNALLDAASSELQAASEEAELLGNSLQNWQDDLGGSLDILLDPNLRTSLGLFTEDFRIEVFPNKTVNIVNPATGNLIINPRTNQPFSLSTNDLIRTRKLSRSEFESLENLLKSSKILEISSILEKSKSIAQSIDNKINSAGNTIKKAFSLITTPAVNAYYAIETEGFSRRGRLGEEGEFSAILPVNRPFSVGIFDQQDNVVSFLSSQSGESGESKVLEIPIILADGDVTDFDNDGLPNQAESIIGTDLNNPDTDGDEISDLAEVEQGLDPLGGRAFPTEIISSLPLRGEAKAIVVQGSTSNVRQQTAYVATGSHGLAIVDASQFNNPIILGQIDLSGDATDIAVDDTLQIVAVATNSGGLQLIDISDPMLPGLVQEINIAASQVEIADGIAYVTEGGQLRAVDLLSGEIIQTLNVPGAENLTGLAREGTSLYTMDAGRTLSAIDISNFRMELRSSLQLPQGAGKLFVSNGIAYASVQSNFQGGFATADVTDPDNITPISASDVTAPFIAPQTKLVTNGSGLGLSIGSNGVNTLDVMNVSNPDNTNELITRIELSSAPQDVAIASGIAFVAGGTAGLQVINYQSFDNQGNAPTVLIDSPLADIDATTEGIQVMEGSSVPLSLEIRDDVQVRNVELLVNGEVITNDVSAPFDFFTIMPTLATGITTAIVQVRATDTGGNRTLSNELTFELVPDTFSPIVVSTTPDIGGAGFDVSSISIRFNEALDTSKVNLVGLTLINLGADGVIGGGDDVVSPIRLVRTPSERRLAIFTQNPLEFGNYQLTLDSAIISDKAGNSLASPFSFQFTSYDLPLDRVVWISDTDGSWNDPSNWNTGIVPRPNDNVVINRIAFEPEITISADAEANSLRSQEAITISGGSLSLTGTSSIDREFVMEAGAELVVKGPGNTFSTSSSVSIESSSMTALDGGIIYLPSLASYTSIEQGQTQFRAEGVDSVIDLPGLTSMDVGSPQSNARHLIEVIDGGRINLAGIQSITTELGNSSGVQIQSSGSDSEINLSSLSEFSNGSSGASSISSFDNGNIVVADSIQLYGVDLRLTNSDGLDFSRIVSYSDGRVIVDASNVSLISLQEITNSNLFVRNGGSLSAPNATRYIASQPYSGNKDFQARGENSVIDLSNISEFIIPSNIGYHRVEALDGGQVNLSQVTSLQIPAGDIASGIRFLAAGSDSEINLSSLENFTDLVSQPSSSLNSRDGGVILASKLTNVKGVNIRLIRSNSIPVSQIQSYQAGELTASGPEVVARLENASDIDDSSFVVLGGATVALPLAKSYNMQDVSVNGHRFFARDKGSLIDLSSLKSISIEAGVWLPISAIGGGEIDLSNVKEISDPATSESQRRIVITVDGAQSLVDLSSLEILSAASTQTVGSKIEVANNGNLFANNIDFIGEVDIDINNSSLSLPSLTTYQGDNLVRTLNSGTLTLINLAEILDGTLTLRADGAESLITAATLPGLTKEEENGGIVTLV